jgi:hypothetical protein
MNDNSPAAAIPGFRLRRLLDRLLIFVPVSLVLGTVFYFMPVAHHAADTAPADGSAASTAPVEAH